MKLSRVYFIILFSIFSILSIFIIVYFLKFYNKNNNKIKNINIIKENIIKDNNNNKNIDSVNITIKKITLKEFEKNKSLELVINAEKCNFLHNTDIVECDNVICTLMEKNIQGACLKTEKALVDRAKKRIFFSGPVHGVIKELTVDARDVYYDFVQQTITTKKNISYTHPDFNIQGGQSFIDLKNNVINMTGNIISEFRVNLNGSTGNNGRN